MHRRQTREVHRAPARRTSMRAAPAAIAGLPWRLARCALATLVVLLCLMIPALVAAYPAHYFVVHEAADGVLSVAFHQLVDISGEPESAPEELPSIFEARLAAAMFEKETGRTLFVPRAVASPWLRGEFAGLHEIDGRTFAVAEKDYVVRIPVRTGTALRLQAEAGTKGIAGATLAIAPTLEIDLDIYAALARAMPPPPAGSSSGSLIQTGNPANRLDLLVVAEGYTAAQQSQFVQQATTLINTFLTISPYKDFAQLINVSWLFVPSTQSGASKPYCAETPTLPVITVSTAFDATFCTGGLRRLVTINTSKVLAAAAGVPDWDMILVLVNDAEYGGSGGSISVATTDASSAGIAQHEFGHSFTRLADEYSSAYPGYPACSDLPAATARCEPNVTDQASRATLKWSRWVDALTPIPTSAPLADPVGTGDWLGARYQSTGMYRQCYDGIMRNLGRPFCHVDSEAFVLRLYGGGWGAPAQGVSFIEPDFTPAGATINAAQNSQVAFTATVAGSLASGGLTASWLVDNSPVQTQTVAHGARQSFTFTVPDTGKHVVELRVSDSTPFLLDRPTRSHLWNVQGVTATITVQAGNGQATRVGTPFPVALTVKVADANGNPVSGKTVQWRAPASGASAQLSAGTSVTDAGGNATVTATASAISGTYAVAATDGTGNVSINLTNSLTISAGSVCSGNALTNADLVEQYYAAILRRGSDAGGKAYWISEADRLCALATDPKATFFLMANSFFNSPEYLALKRDDNGFVTDLYITFFGRLPDAGGLIYWTGQIAAGMPRNIVMSAFLFSSEYAATMNGAFPGKTARAETYLTLNLYGGLFRRLADSGGYAYWDGQFRKAQCSTSPAATVQAMIDLVSSQFLSSAEYTNRATTNSQFVQDLYYALLQRGGDLGGFNFWVGQLASGQTRNYVRQQFLQSPEMTAQSAAIAAQGCLP